MSGLETHVIFTPDLRDFEFPDQDFSLHAMPEMPRGDLPPIKSGIEGARKRLLDGESGAAWLI